VKKSLSTTCLVTLLTSTTLADVNFDTTNIGCKIDLGAEVFVEAGTRMQSKNDTLYNVTKNNSDIGFNSNADIHLTIQHETKNNWTYGMQAGLSSNIRSSSKAGKHYLDRTYLWADKDNFGRIEVGGNVSAANEMKISESSAGSWDNYTSLDTNASGAAGVRGRNFLKSDKLVLKEGSFEQFGSHERARKITYFTPKYEGFQFGISYIPDVANSGNTTQAIMPNTDTNGNRQENNAFASGITWEKKIDSKQKIELALVGETSTPKRSGTDAANNRTYHKSKALVVGGNYIYDDLTLTLAYGNHWKTNTQKISADIPNTFFYNIAVSYDMTDKLNLSSSIFYSEKFNNPMTITAVGVDYNIAPGLKPYAKITYFNMNQKNNYTDVAFNAAGTSTLLPSKFRNEGTVFILGSKLKF